jgi:hypothetical protein
MKTFETMNNDRAAAVLCSRRFQNGVEIIEREVHQVVAINGRSEAAPPARPSLVIGDAISSATKLFISKTRSEIAGLETLLKSLTSPALKTK